MLKWILRANRFLLAFLLFSAIFLIGIMDYFSGKEVVYSAFYALPIIGITYLVNVRSGIAASILSSFIATFTDFYTLTEITLVIGWNFISRILLFLTLVFLINFLKKKIEAEQQAAEMQRFFVKEIHHRLSNNIATTIGMLHLQMMREKVSVQYLMPIERRLTAMLNVHKKLYRQSGLLIHLKEYLNELVSSFSETYQLSLENIKIILTCDAIDIIDTKAQTIGLLINELMINSVKYAFNEKQNGVIKIRVSRNNKDITIDYHDNGIGFDYVSNNGGATTTGIGMQLIEGFAKELNANVTFKRHKGIHFKFEFSAEG